MRKRVLAIMLVLAMCITVIGCRAKPAPEVAPEETTTQEAAPAEEVTEEAATQEAKPEEIKLVVGYMPNYASLCGQVAADNIGAFAEQGITMEMVEFADGPTIIAAMESGTVDIGYIGPGAHKLCIEGRAKIFMTAHFGHGDAVIASKDKGITTVEELKGKTVAYTTGTSSQAILESTLASAGMTMSDIKAMDMDASGIVTAMLSGSVDACATWSPGTYKIMDELGDDAVDLTQSGDTPDIASWIVNSSYYEKNANKVLRFSKALLKGMNYRADKGHYEEVAKWSADAAALDYNTVLLDVEVADWLTSDRIVELINDGTLEKYYKGQQDKFRASGSITVDEVPVSEYVMFDNMLEAAK